MAKEYLQGASLTGDLALILDLQLEMGEQIKLVDLAHNLNCPWSFVLCKGQMTMDR